MKRIREEERLSTYTFAVPLIFKFDARTNVDSETLNKMAQSYLDLVLTTGKFEIDEKNLYLKTEQKHYTPEELKDIRLGFDEFIRNCMRRGV